MRFPDTIRSTDHDMRHEEAAASIMASMPDRAQPNDCRPRAERILGETRQKTIGKDGEAAQMPL